MSNYIKYRNFVADFETTVFKGQKRTEVWLSGSIPLDMKTHPDNVSICHSLDGFMAEAFNLPGNKKYYFLNLKFDGTFIISWLYNNGFEPYTWWDTEIGPDGQPRKVEKYIGGKITEMPTRTFKTLIDSHGQWYSITAHWKNKFITFVDLLKLLPFSVAAISDAFDCQFSKLEIGYEGERYAGCSITKEEEEYQKNDVLVIHEALNKFFEMSGVEKMTIGSICMYEFDRTCCHDKEERKKKFPDLTKIDVPDFIRRKNETY